MTKHRVTFIALATLALFGGLGCSSKCQRHSDCGSGPMCVGGTCVVVVDQGTAGSPSVDAMTPAASPTTTATAPKPAPTTRPVRPVPDASTQGPRDGATARVRSPKDGSAANAPRDAASAG
jgi:hypothetical protein